MNEFQCTKCKKQFYPDKQEIKIKRNLKYIKCPHCGHKYEKVTQLNGSYMRKKNGQLINLKKKARMSKKQRLKIRKLANEKD